MAVARPVLFTPDARAEVIAAQKWYAERSFEGGARFGAELERTVQHIADSPLQFPVVLGDVRRALMRRYPYSLFFRIESDTVTVIACFRASRDPQVWQRRAEP